MQIEDDDKGHAPLQGSFRTPFQVFQSACRHVAASINNVALSFTTSTTRPFLDSEKAKKGAVALRSSSSPSSSSLHLPSLHSLQPNQGATPNNSVEGFHLIAQTTSSSLRLKSKRIVSWIFLLLASVFGALFVYYGSTWILRPLSPNVTTGSDNTENRPFQKILNNNINQLDITFPHQNASSPLLPSIPQNPSETHIVTDEFVTSWDAVSLENLRLLTGSDKPPKTGETGTRYLRVTGFQFCHILNNSTFDTMIPVSHWGGQTIAERDRPIENVVQLIDGIARQVMGQMYGRNQFLDPEEVTRFSCYCAADGANTVARLSDARLLHSVNAQSYFSSQLPSIIPPPRRRDRMRKRFYKVAYLIAVRGDAHISANVKNLIDELDDGSAIILLHVDIDAEKTYQELVVFVQEREDRIRSRLPPSRSKEKGNVYFSKKRFKSISRHISLLWIQLNAYWELLDLAYWDYVVNLSPMDVPLRKSRELQRILSLPEYRGLSFISHWADFDKLALRMTRPHLARYDAKSTEKTIFHPRETGMMFPPFRKWKMCQQSPWMILSRDIPRFVRSSEEALMVLAYMEHTLKPDETFFCYIIMNTPHLRPRSLNDSKRFVRTKPLTLNDTNDLGWPTSSTTYVDAEIHDPRYLFISNVDLRTDEGWDLWEWMQRNQVNRYLHKMEMYGNLGGREFVPPVL